MGGKALQCMAGCVGPCAHNGCSDGAVEHEDVFALDASLLRALLQIEYPDFMEASRGPVLGHVRCTLG